MNIGTICIIGLSSAGKTTLARKIITKLRENNRPCALIDGDDVRNLFQIKSGFDPKSRKQQSLRILRMAQWVEKQQIIPVIAMIHPFEEERQLFRQSLNNYFQIYLNCSVQDCQKRDQKGVYGLDGKTQGKNIVGVDIPYEKVLTTELDLACNLKSADLLLEETWQALEQRFFTRNK